MTTIGPNDYGSAKTIPDAPDDVVWPGIVEADASIDPGTSTGGEASPRRRRRTSVLAWCASAGLLIALAAGTVVTVRWTGTRDDLAKTRDDLRNAWGEVAEREDDLDAAREEIRKAEERADKTEAEMRDLDATITAVEDFFVAVNAAPPEPLEADVTRCLIDELGLHDYAEVSKYFWTTTDPEAVPAELTGKFVTAAVTCKVPM